MTSEYEICPLLYSQGVKSVAMSGIQMQGDSVADVVDQNIIDHCTTCPFLTCWEDLPQKIRKKEIWDAYYKITEEIKELDALCCVRISKADIRKSLETQGR